MGRAEHLRAGDVAVGAVAALRIPFWLGTARLNELLAEPRHANRRGRDPELAVKAAFLALRLLARLRSPLWRNTCLYRSIAQCLVLRSYGIPCCLRIGVTAPAPAPNGEAASIDAHAWVERLDTGETLPAPRGLALLR